MKRLALLAVALVAFGGVARAEDPPPPLGIRQGVPAPSDGVFLTVDRAALIASACEREKARADSLQKSIEEKPVAISGDTSTTVVAVVAFTLGIAAGAFAVVKFSK